MRSSAGLRVASENFKPVAGMECGRARSPSRLEKFESAKQEEQRKQHQNLSQPWLQCLESVDQTLGGFTP